MAEIQCTMLRDCGLSLQFEQEEQKNLCNGKIFFLYLDYILSEGYIHTVF